MLGGADNDVVRGADGADTIVGGDGDDILTGGKGIDTFKFDNSAPTATDVIRDFSATRDILALETGLSVNPTFGTGDYDRNGSTDTLLTLSNGAKIWLLGVTGLDHDDLKITIVASTDPLLA